MEYPEIEQLKVLFLQHQVEITKLGDAIRKDLFFVHLTIGRNTWKILVDDEYRDFTEGKSLMNWFLVLYALELYEETEDILEWSNELNVSPTELLEYYRTLASIYREIEAKIGQIDACVSSFDYNLRTGVVQALLECDIS